MQRFCFDKVMESIETLCGANDADYELYVSRYPRDAVGFIRKKLSAQTDSGASGVSDASGASAPNEPDKKIRVYAVGGGGTLYDCLNGIAESGVELSAVPLGSANDFIKSFNDEAMAHSGVPAEFIFRDVAQLYSGHSVKLDMFSCNANHAISYCAIGAEARAARFACDMLNIAWRCPAVLRRFAKLSSFPNYCYALGRIAASRGAKDSASRRANFYSIKIDDKDYSGNYSSIIITNGSCFCCGKTGTRGALPWDGSLNIILYESDLSTSVYKNGFFETRGKKISVKQDNFLDVALDGEVFQESSIDIAVVPSAVNFVVPKTILRAEELL